MHDHWLLRGLGTGKPAVTGDFDPAYLAACARRRKVAIKNLLMNARVVVGVGNIYANEALFLAGIRPRVAAGRVTRGRLAELVAAVKSTLASASKVAARRFGTSRVPTAGPATSCTNWAVYGAAASPASAVPKP